MRWRSRVRNRIADPHFSFSCCRLSQNTSVSKLPRRVATGGAGGREGFGTIPTALPAKKGVRLLERDVHLGEAPGCGGVHGNYDPVDVPAQHGPLRVSEDDDCDFSPL